MATLTFLGAAQQVTGSCYLLETPTLGRVLLDAGLHQGGDFEGDMTMPLAFAPKTIDTVILSHAHLDHSGLLPVLVHQGFKGPIYCTKATAGLLRIMLKDAEGLYEKDLEYANLRRARRGEKALKPAYTQRDVHTVLTLCEPIRYGECLLLGEGASLCFHDAGHILGSAIVELKFRDGKHPRTLVFSGDLGKRNSVLMNDPEMLEHADLVMMESTYGDRDHEAMPDTLRQFEKVLRDTWAKKGNVLIPAFAVGRTQEILYYLGQLHDEGKLDHWQIFLDSPMAIEITQVYESCSDLLDPEDGCRLKVASMKHLVPQLRYAKTPDESRAINRVTHGAIIIAGSGMCTGGRIRHHLKQRIWNARNTIVFAGFQARGTLGRRIADGAKIITMFGDEFAVRARVEILSGFSAHAGQSELVEWISHFRDAPRVMLVHGEPDALDALAQKLWQEKKIATEIPYPGQKIGF
ncbi:MAG: MBL fold metallo-hydrolase [Pseudomonadales bacterium]|jgi:metallo-beta-lactamase family protein|nr:MBL fold metallo-hydrolase [Pseudomonadales bacterium]